MTLPTNLTALQGDSAIFLPALSTFYSLFVGRQRASLARGETPYIPLDRIPHTYPKGVESGNWLHQDGLWQYQWTLHSAGHATLGEDKTGKEGMYRERDRDISWLLGDSGGFQIGKGKWEGDWKTEDCPKAGAKRESVLKWMDDYMDYGMCLDIPGWTKTAQINNPHDALAGTLINNEYFIRERNGNCKFLNVMQGKAPTSRTWYENVRKFCDPKQYSSHFDGWAMGDDHMFNLPLALRRIVDMIEDGYIDKGLHDWMHFLGTSKLEWAVALTCIQQSIRKHVNENFTISFDCASPFLASVNGKIYTHYELDNNSNWSYLMADALKDKAYAARTDNFDQACLDKFGEWFPSPTTDDMALNEFCVYKEGDVDRNGKNPSTSWDSFSYFLMMHHNTYLHIRAVQEANRRYQDREACPRNMQTDHHTMEEFAEVIDEIIRSPWGKAHDLINENHKLLEGLQTSRDGTLLTPNASVFDGGEALLSRNKEKVVKSKPKIDGELADALPKKALAEAKKPRKKFKPIGGLFE